MIDNDPKTVLLMYLNRVRDAVAWKLEGLSEYDARRPLTATGTNMLGVVKHLALVELGYFGEVFGRTPQVSVPWWQAANAAMEERPNSDMYASAGESRDEVLTLLREAGRNTEATAAALGLDAPGRVPWWGAQGEVTLHRILVHQCVESARHAGQLDILREQLDGAVGVRSAGDNLPDFDEDAWAAYRAELQAIADGFAEPPAG